MLIAGLATLNAAPYAYFKHYVLSDMTSASTEYMWPVGVGLLLLLCVAWRPHPFGRRQAAAARSLGLIVLSRRLSRSGTRKAIFETVWLALGVATFVPLVFRVAFDGHPLVDVPFFLCGVGFVVHIVLWIHAMRLQVRFASAIDDLEFGVAAPLGGG